MQSLQKDIDIAQQSIINLRKIRMEMMNSKEQHELNDFEIREKAAEGVDTTAMANDLLVSSQRLIKSKKRFRAALRDTKEAVTIVERNAKSPEEQEQFRILLQGLAFLEFHENDDVQHEMPTRRRIPVPNRQSVHFRNPPPSVLPRIVLTPAQIQAPSQTNFFAPPNQNSRAIPRLRAIPALIPMPRPVTPNRSGVAQLQSGDQRSQISQLPAPRQLRQPTVGSSAENVRQKIEQHQERMAQRNVNRPLPRTSTDENNRTVKARSVANDLQRQNMMYRPTPDPRRSPRVNDQSLSRTLMNQSNVSGLQRSMQSTSRTLTPGSSVGQSSISRPTTPGRSIQQPSASVRSHSPHGSSPVELPMSNRVEELRTGISRSPRSPRRSTGTQRPVSPLARLSTSGVPSIQRELSLVGANGNESSRMCCNRTPRALTARPPVPLDDGSVSRLPSPWLRQPSRGLSPPSRSHALDQMSPQRTSSRSNISTSGHTRSRRTLTPRSLGLTSQPEVEEAQIIASQIPKPPPVSRLQRPNSRIPGSKLPGLQPVMNYRNADPSGISRIATGAAPSGITRIPKGPTRNQLPSVRSAIQHPIEELQLVTPPRVVASKLKTSVRAADTSSPRQINISRSSSRTMRSNMRARRSSLQRSLDAPSVIVPFIFSPGMEVPEYVIERDILYVANQMVGVDPEDLPVENSRVVRALIQIASHFKSRLLTAEQALRTVKSLFWQMHCIPIDFMNSFIFHPRNEYFNQLDFEYGFFNTSIRNSRLHNQNKFQCDGNVETENKQLISIAMVETLLEAFDDSLIHYAKGIGAISKGKYKPKHTGPNLMGDVLVVGREQSNNGQDLLAVPGNFEGNFRHGLLGREEQLNYLRTGAIPRANVLTGVIEDDMRSLEDRLIAQGREVDHLENSRIYGRGLRYELKPTALSRQNFWQARGDDIPSWFPGLITVFQDSYDLKPVLQPSPSAILLHAWRTMGPRVEIAV